MAANARRESTIRILLAVMTLYSIAITAVYFNAIAVKRHREQRTGEARSVTERFLSDWKLPELKNWRFVFAEAMQPASIKQPTRAHLIRVNGLELVIWFTSELDRPRIAWIPYFGREAPGLDLPLTESNARAAIVSYLGRRASNVEVIGRTIENLHLEQSGELRKALDVSFDHRDYGAKYEARLDIETGQLLRLKWTE